jgi:hypothetical protein
VRQRLALGVVPRSAPSIPDESPQPRLLSRRCLGSLHPAPIHGNAVLAAGGVERDYELRLSLGPSPPDPFLIGLRRCRLTRWTRFPRSGSPVIVRCNAYIAAGDRIWTWRYKSVCAGHRQTDETLIAAVRLCGLRSGRMLSVHSRLVTREVDHILERRCVVVY